MTIKSKDLPEKTELEKRVDNLELLAVAHGWAVPDRPIFDPNPGKSDSK